MQIKALGYELTVCKIKSFHSDIVKNGFYFLSQTDEELSLVCETENTPPDTTDREDGWKAFRIEGVLDFSLVGILAPIASLLADARIGIFAVSTYNTDYVLVKKENFDAALDLLAKNGYTIVNQQNK